MPRATDDRGRRVSLYGLPAEHNHPWALRTIPLDEHRRFTLDLRRRMRPLTLPVFAAGVGAAVGVMIFIQWGVQRVGGAKSTADIVMFAVVLVLSLLHAVGMKTLVHRRYGRDLIALFLFEGRCPQCAFELEGCVVEPDGCAPCPECGAAWRVANESPTG